MICHYYQAIMFPKLRTLEAHTPKVTRINLAYYSRPYNYGM